MGFVRKVFRTWKKLERVVVTTSIYEDGAEIEKRAKKLVNATVGYLKRCSENIQFDEKALEAEDIKVPNTALHYLELVRSMILEVETAKAAAMVNEYARSAVEGEHTPDDPQNSYDRKRTIANTINDFLSEKFDMTIMREGEPSLIYAIASRDGFGRYTFESKLTRKRSGSYKSVLDILPLEVTENPPRKKTKKD